MNNSRPNNDGDEILTCNFRAPLINSLDFFYWLRNYVANRGYQTELWAFDRGKFKDGDYTVGRIEFLADGCTISVKVYQDRVFKLKTVRFSIEDNPDHMKVHVEYPAAALDFIIQMLIDIKQKFPSLLVIAAAVRPDDQDSHGTNPKKNDFTDEEKIKLILAYYKQNQYTLREFLDQRSNIYIGTRTFYDWLEQFKDQINIIPKKQRVPRNKPNLPKNSAQ